MFNGMNGLEIMKNWPRFEDGEPVRVGDSAPFGTDDVMEVVGVEINRFGYVLHGSINDGMRECVDGDEHGVAVKRPAPKVLDADGAEIEVGDDLYSVEGSLKFHVSHVDRINEKIATDAMFSLDKWADPAMYTHRAPVLAADGRPLREGETVYHVNSGIEYSVRSVTNGGAHLSKGDKPGGYCKADYLTHERPVADTWERLEEDVANASCPDVYCANHHIDASDASYEWAMARDIVRRAKALAERDAK